MPIQYHTYRLCLLKKKKNVTPNFLKASYGNCGGGGNCDGSVVVLPSLQLENFKILGLKQAILVLKTATNHQNLDQNRPSSTFGLKNVNG